MIKLEKGYWGSNCMTLGVRNYRGFHVVVDNDMDLPTFNSDFVVGIYELEDDYEGIEVALYSGYSEERCAKEIDFMIDGILARRAALNIHETYKRAISASMSDEQLKALFVSECTCGAKHTSNSSFHLSWCDKK